MNDSKEFIEDFDYDYICDFYSSVVPRTINESLAIGMSIESAIGFTENELDASNIDEDGSTSNDYLTCIVFNIELIIDLLNKKEKVYAKHQLNKLLKRFDKTDLNEIITVLKEFEIIESVIKTIEDRIKIIFSLM